MGRCKRFESRLAAVAVLAIALLAAGQSAADWKVYVSAGLGISGADTETDGQADDGVTVVGLSGSDTDESPLIDGAVGIEIPMDEILPREWTLDVRLPDWPTRFEIEAAGLREYEFSTVAQGEKFFTEFDTTTTFFNTWLDIPMVSAYKPIQYMFGLGRQPAVRRFLEPVSFYLGAGVGFQVTDIDGTSNLVSGDDDDIYDFAWNVGTGVNYSLTERVFLSAGYRYVGLGDQDIDIVAGPATGDVEYDTDIHEFRFAVRVRVYEFLSPWR